MAKITPMVLIDKMSGKVCSHSDVYFRTYLGNCFTGKICNPRTKPFSASEVARQEKFGKAVRLANSELADPGKLTTIEALFNAQKSYGKKTLHGFAVAYIMQNGTMSGDDLTISWE